MRIFVAALLVAACATPRSASPPTPPLPMPAGAMSYCDQLPHSVRVLGTPITGRVLLDGDPVPFFEVTLVDDATFMPGLLSSVGTPFLRPTPVRSTDGRFQVPARDGNARDLIISGPGFERRIVPAARLNGFDAGDVEVSRGHRIEGTVRDEAGAPVANARVTFSPSPWIAAHDRGDPLTDLVVGKISVEADASGHFVVQGAAPEPHWSQDPSPYPVGPMQLRAWTSDQRSSLPTSVNDADATIDLTVRPTGSIQVSAPAVNDIVLLSLQADADPYMIIAAPYSRATTRSFRDLPVGDYKLTRMSDWSRRPIQRVSIQANSVTTVVISGTQP